MEQEKRATKKRLILFVVLSLTLGWVAFMLIPLLGLTYGQNLSIVILAGAMFTPTISNLLTRLITKEGFKNMYLRPHFKGHIKAYLLVFFGPTVILFLSGAFYFLIFPGTFDPKLVVLKNMLAAKGPGGISATDLLLISALQVIFIGPVVNIIPTLGEELGWRGYLLPKLREFFSDRGALVITGGVWGVWHAPIIAMGHNYGTEYIGYPWLGILAMIIFCVAVGIVEGYATIKLQSAIPAAMIHSAVNAGAALPIYLAGSGYNPILGPSMTGLVGGIPLILVAIVLFIKVGKQKTERIPNKSNCSLQMLRSIVFYQ